MGSLESFYAANAPYLWAGTTALVVVLLALAIVLQARVGRLVARQRRLMAGAEVGTVAEALEREIARIDAVSGRAERFEALLHGLDAQVDRAIQRVGVVRFNPFNDTGGDQSFSVALLDARGDGVVLSSLFKRADSRIFAKPVARGQSTYALSDEEREAIRLAVETAEAPEGR